MKSKMIKVFCLSLLSVLIISGCDQQENKDVNKQVEKPRPAKIVKLKSSGIEAIRTYPGTLEAAQKTALAFRVSGELIELQADSGMPVNKGDVLAQLDETDFKKALDERQTRYNLAKIQYEQANKLVEKGLGSKINLDQAQAELKIAQNALEVARDNLNIRSYMRLLMVLSRKLM